MRTAKIGTSLVLIDADELWNLIGEAVSTAMGRRDQEPALLDRARLAKALCCSVPTIDRLRRAGMPTVMIIEAPRFELDAVLGWLRGRNQLEFLPRGDR